MYFIIFSTIIVVSFRLKKQIKLPKDRNLLQQLETCVRKLLMSEKDRDTLESLDKAVKEFDSIQVLPVSIKTFNEFLFI